MGSRWLAACTALAVAAACTGGAPEPSPLPAQSGGTFRAAIEDFGFEGGFDPTPESSRLGMALHSQLLLRTLSTYRHVAGPPGTEPVPDLAATTGEVSEDGLTWTFTLKDGARFGPPVDRPITSTDVEFAFRRIATGKLDAGYGYLYFGLIQGMAGPVDPMPSDIAGIETPNPRTVVFHLSRPAGDFLHRLALPATAPMPAEVADCFDRPGDYGRDLVSTGPYMIEGADRVNVSSCPRIRPMAGFDRTHFLHFVRNPEYDPKTDDQVVRESLPDRIEIAINTNTDDILFQIEKGSIDSTLGIAVAPQVIAGRHRLVVRQEPLNNLEYLSMNVLVPPFDDVHVRRAVNLVLNRRQIARAFAGRGGIATRVFPPFHSTERKPSVKLEGDIPSAQAEMSQSPYDQNGDGQCDVDACKHVLYIGPTVPPEVVVFPQVQQDLLDIGIVLKVRELVGATAYRPYQTVQSLIPISLQRQLLIDYPDEGSVARALHSGGISCEDQINFSEVGITEKQARTCGVLRQYRAVADHLPSLDNMIDVCERRSGEARSSCWATFDGHVRREVVPWAPIWYPDILLVSGRTLTKFEYDQAFGTLSLAHVAVAA